MSLYIARELSPRHAIPFSHLPTVRGSMYGGSIVRHYPDSYASILDSTLEMTRDLRDANGITAEQAIAQVLRDENWRVMPRHQKLILQRLEAT